MSEQSAIAQLGDGLFGRGPQAALQALNKSFELAFLKSLSQLSSPSLDAIVDRTGHIGIAREISNYKVSRSLAQALTARVDVETDPRVQEVLKLLACEFEAHGAGAGKRIVQASAFASDDTTVEDALSEIFQYSPEEVAGLLEPTPGAEWSTYQIVGAVQDLLAAGSKTEDILCAIRGEGVWRASQSMTELSLGLEKDMLGSDDPQAWHAIAGKAGGAALLLDMLFNNGFAAAKDLNTTTPFYEDPALLGMVRDVLNGPDVDFSAVEEYLNQGQALALLVHAIDAGFGTDDLNQLLDASVVSSDGLVAVQTLLARVRELLIPDAPALAASDSAAYYRAVFGTIDLVETKYGDTLDLDGLVSTNAASITAHASQDSDDGIAYRYALVELNAFVLIGADYQPHNENGELDLYDDKTGEGTLTLEYLADRPELLAAMMQANLGEIAPDATGVTQLDGLDATYIDRDDGLTMTGTAPVAGVVMFDGDANAPLLGGAGNDRLYGEGGADQMEGGDGDDLLDGGEGADVLTGGAGDDVLTGGAGDDRLVGGIGRDVLRGGAGSDQLVSGGDGDMLDGGVGNDSYFVRKGDVIQDSDGIGTIFFDDADSGDSGDGGGGDGGDGGGTDGGGTDGGGDNGGGGGGIGPTPIGAGTQVDGSELFLSDDGRVLFRENDDGSLDLWVDGDRVTVRPSDQETGPRVRREDGSTPDDPDSGSAPRSGKPMLGLPMRKLNGPGSPSYKQPFDEAMAVPAPRRDPLLLDLDGDGIETLSQQAVTYFDHDANGFAELSGWVGADDGLLAMDRDGNGRIDSGRELFGDQTLLADGSTAAGGVQALSEWDAAAAGGNGDGLIDASDAVWSSLRVWRDLDSDGFTDAGELSALGDLGVSAISLSFADTGADDGKGNAQARLGSFARTDGTQGALGEYLLARNTAISVAESTVATPLDVAGMPQIRGSGNAHDLRQAMARDAGLKELVSAFLQESDAARRDAVLDSILFRWAGADVLDPASRGEAIDARKLAVLEQFLAQPFVGALGPDPVPDAAVRLERAYLDLSEQVYGSLMAQSHLDGLYQQITYRWDAAAGAIKADLSPVIAAIDAQLAADPAAGKALLSEFARTMRALDELPAADYAALRATYAARSEELAIAFDTGGLNLVSEVGGNKIEGTTGADSLLGSAGNDSVTGFDGDDVVYGLDGNDTLSGCEDNDLIFGGLGDDNLFGGTGDDLLDGGLGRDYLNGGSGNDTYVLARGGGMDHVRDYDASAGNVDVIRVDAALTQADVRYWRAGNDLYVGVAGADDSLRIEGWFLDSAHRVEEVVFGDGTRLTAEVLAEAHLAGTEAADAILGTAGADVLEGLGGDDSLQGGHADDVLDGGAGNDALYGGFSGGAAWSGSGNDTYVFGRGYGQDTIYDRDTSAGNVDSVRLVGLNAGDVVLRRVGNDLRIEVKDSGDSLRVANWGAGTEHRIERIEFADGSVLEGAALSNLPFLGTEDADSLSGSAEADMLMGLGGEDVLVGGYGDDVLDGGAGNDTLHGGFTTLGSWSGAGNDTYVFGRGYGRDVVSDYDITAGNVDTVRLKDFNAGDVTIRRDTSNLYISVNGAADELRVANWGAGSGYRIERVQFADGSVLEGAALAQAAAYLGTEGADTLTGTADSEGMRGLGSDDVLAGGYGDDVLDGGAGDDILYGGFSGTYDWSGAGNDTYVFGRGYGKDVIYDHDTSAGNTDTVRLVGLNQADVTIRRDTGSLYISVNGSADQLQVAGWGSSAAYRIERIEFADGSALDGAALAAAPFLGTDAADTLSGTAGDDVMRGLGGNDSLSGGAGNDVIDGGAGNDALYGGVSGNLAGAGAGNDTYVFGRGYGQDVIYDFDATAGNLDMLALAGLTAADVTIRRDQSSLFVGVKDSTDVLRVADWGGGSAYRIERIVFADGSVMDQAALALAPYLGTDGGDSIVGTSDNEVMRGFNGNDTLAGMAGDDLLEGGDGNDTLKGEAGNDALIGGGGNDLLYAGAGNDLLDGGTGNDRMYGYGGDDMFWVDSSADKVFEGTNEGIDTVVSSIDYSISDKVNLENITLVGDAVSAVGNASSNILRGNERDNSLVGGAGNDLLDGGAGADAMAGGAGNDTYVVDNAGDLVSELANEGIDAVESSASVTLGAFVENVQLTGTGAANATGNELANSMIGNSAGNALAGGAGQDTIQGGGGDDLLGGGDGADSLDGGAGVDVLQGDADNDTLRDADGNGLLDGGAGADDIRSDSAASFVAGGEGDDLIAVNAAAAVVAHNRGDGQDTLALNAERVTLSLGGGTGYQDLALRKSGDSLVLELGSGDALTLDGWYDESQTRPNEATLQMLAQAIEGFEPGAADPLLDQRIETFDFKRLAAEFDAALGQDPTLDRWTPMHKLLDAQLGGYDSEALGGELAYVYGMNGSFAGMGLGTAQDTLRAPGFGQQTQTIGNVEQPGQTLKLT